MTDAEIEQLYPRLARTNWKRTSDPTHVLISQVYNCFAWAAGDNKRWWDPHPKRGYWPYAAPRAMTIDAFEQAYATVGFSPCTDEKPEEGFEKIAIYTLNGVPTHAARLLDTGEWTSKLGYEADISHPLHGLDRNDGPQPYGAPAVFMRRPV